MSTTITRTAIVDDDGSLTLGTAIDNAWKQELYDQIDDLFANGLELADYLTVAGDSNGVAAFAGDRYSHVLVAAGLNANPLTAEHQVGFYAALQANDNVDGVNGFVAGFESGIGLAAGSYTVGKMAAFAVGNFGPFGAGAAATRTWNLSCYDQTHGTNNAAIAMWDATFTGNWFLYYTGARHSQLTGMRFDATGQCFIQEDVGILVNPSLGIAFTGTGNFGSGIELVNTTDANNASFAVFVANGVKAGEITRVGTTAAVVYTTTSDERLKDHFTNFDDALDRVLQIDAGTFTWKRDGQKGSGFKAQQLHAIYPDAVQVGETESQHWRVDKGAVTPLLVGAIKELAARVAALEAHAG